MAPQVGEQHLHFDGASLDRREVGEGLGKRGEVPADKSMRTRLLEMLSGQELDLSQAELDRLALVGRPDAQH